MRLRCILLTCMLLLLGSLSVYAVDSSGTCGDDVTWSLVGDTLTISGTGPMYDYADDNRSPWDSSKDSIVSVVVGEGIISIGDYAFIDCSNLSSVLIPESVTSIGSHAFCDSYNLVSVQIPSGVTLIREGTFAGCNSLSFVIIPSTVTVIGDWAFQAVASSTLVIPESVISIGNNAFTECTSLVSLTILNPNITLGSDLFLDAAKMLDGTGKVYIPSGASILSSKLQALGINSSSIVELPVVTEVKWLPGVHSIYDFESSGTDLQFPYDFEAPDNGTYTIYAKNADGGETVEVITVTNIDKTVPSAILQIASATSDPNQTFVTIEVQAGDSSSGIKCIKWLSGNRVEQDFVLAGIEIFSTSTPEVTTQQVTFDVRTNGTFAVFVEDFAGNIFINTIDVSNIDVSAIIPVILTSWDIIFVL